MQIERLKDFSENIVESLKIGVVTVDLDDRVESWNPQLEDLLSISRADALQRRCRKCCRRTWSRKSLPARPAIMFPASTSFA